jgi:hypothetical protein
MSGAPSYRLKIDRAAEQLVEIKRLAAAYERPRPYNVTHRIEGKNKEHVYRAYPVEGSDSWIAVIVGDFLFNLRSALDHLRVALVPRKRRYNGSFPIFTEDIWERDLETGDYAERTADARAFWKSSVAGMSKRAIAAIDTMQPFRFPDDQIEHLTLSILSRLNNADKHRELVPVVHHLKPMSVTVYWLDGSAPEVRAINSDGFAGGSGAVIERLDRELRVEASGSLKVAVGARDNPKFGGYGLPETCEIMIGFLANEVIPRLEPFVRS